MSDGRAPQTNKQQKKIQSSVFAERMRATTNDRGCGESRSIFMVGALGMYENMQLVRKWILCFIWTSNMHIALLHPAAVESKCIVLMNT